jgi:GH15 family glucan-1,4-alpha-glucosidase
MSDLDLWPIGNSQVSALIDRAGRFVWACVPRVDGDPLFSALVGGEAPEAGYWAIDLEDGVSVEQHYLRNTPILISRHTDAAGNAIEVVDFCPRFERLGRIYRPVAFARIVRPVAGSPRIRVSLRPARGWGEAGAERTSGSNHLRYLLGDDTVRLTTDAPVGMIEEERVFRIERPLHFFLGPDEPFSAEFGASIDQMLANTTAEWQHWVRGLAIPLEWQEVVIRDHAEAVPA